MPEELRPEKLLIVGADVEAECQRLENLKKEENVELDQQEAHSLKETSKKKKK